MLLDPLEFGFAASCICAALLWVRHRKFHELAVGIVADYCRSNALQLLDGTVAFRGFRFERWPWHICRSFRFDYSLNGVDRHKAQLTLCGTHTQSFRVNPEHLTGNATATSRATRETAKHLLSSPHGPNNQ